MCPYYALFHSIISLLDKQISAGRTIKRKDSKTICSDRSSITLLINQIAVLRSLNDDKRYFKCFWSFLHPTYVEYVNI